MGRVDPSGLSFSAAEAAKYARDWAKKRNPNYDDFKERGDCANFASQAMAAGGIRQNGTWYTIRGVHGWKTSRSWSVAQDLYTYFATRQGRQIAKYTKAVKTKYLSKVTIGDLLFLDWSNRNGAYVDHSAVITGNSRSTGTLYSAHDTDARSRTWTDLWENAKSNAVIYIVRPRS